MTALAELMAEGAAMGGAWIGGLYFRWYGARTSLLARIREDLVVEVIETRFLSRAPTYAVIIESPERTIKIPVQTVGEVERALRRARAVVRQEKQLAGRSAELEPGEVEAIFYPKAGGYQVQGRLLSEGTRYGEIILERFGRRLPGGIGAHLGVGSEGQVYELGPDRVIKIFMVDTYGIARQMLRVLGRLKALRSPYAARILDYGFVGRLLLPPRPGRHRRDWSEDMIYSFYYVAERLEPIDMATHEAARMHVMVGLENTGIFAGDLRFGNLMRSKDGRIKLADIGRFVSVR